MTRSPNAVPLRADYSTRTSIRYSADNVVKLGSVKVRAAVMGAYDGEVAERMFPGDRSSNARPLRPPLSPTLPTSVALALLTALSVSRSDLHSLA
jgi:hypothetical protein